MNIHSWQPPADHQCRSTHVHMNQPIMTTVIGMTEMRLSVYMAPCLKGQCRLLCSSTWNCKYSNAYNYIHKGNDYKLQIVYFYSGHSIIQQLVIKGHFTYNSCSWKSEITTYIHIHIAYRLEHFEHIGFKLALKCVIHLKWSGSNFHNFGP